MLCYNQRKGKKDAMTKNRLKDLRKAIGKSQKDFYNEIVVTELNLGVTLRTYQNWEKPENEIKSKPANSLADYFKVPVSYLLGYDDKLTVGDAMEILEAVSSGTISPNDKIAKKIIESQNRTITNAKLAMEQNYEKTKGFDLISNVRFLSLLIENYDKVCKAILFYIAPRIERDELTDIEIKALEDFIKLLDSHFGDNQDDVVYTHDFIHEFLKQKSTPTDND